MQNDVFNRSYAAEYTIAAGEANTDVVKSVTVTLDTGGTWQSYNTRSLTVLWCLMSGSTFQTSPSVWAAGNFLGSANQYNFMGTAGNVFELFDVSLTEGSVAPPFMVPDYASELQACRRYWYKITISTLGYNVWYGRDALAKVSCTRKLCAARLQRTTVSREPHSLILVRQCLTVSTQRISGFFSRSCQLGMGFDDNQTVTFSARL